MEYQLKKTWLSVATFLLFFSSCADLDVSNMVVTDVSVNQRFQQSEDWNLQHPFTDIAVASDNYTILSMSDSHIGGTEHMDAFFNYADDNNVTAAVMVGDLATGHAEDYEVFYQHLPPVDSVIWFPVVGNHDLYFDGWDEFYSRFGSSTYYFTVSTPVATDLFICLDSGGGTLGDKQLEWFRDILQNVRPDYRRCIVYTHVNLFRLRHTTSTNPLIEEVRVLLDLFTVHHVDMVVTGHDHVKYEDTFGNTIHLSMDALKDDCKNAGYLELNVNNGDLNYNFINF